MCEATQCGLARGRVNGLALGLGECAVQDANTDYSGKSHSVLYCAKIASVCVQCSLQLGHIDCALYTTSSVLHSSVYSFNQLLQCVAFLMKSQCQLDLHACAKSVLMFDQTATAS